MIDSKTQVPVVTSSVGQWVVDIALCCKPTVRIVRTICKNMKEVHHCENIMLVVGLTQILLPLSWSSMTKINIRRKGNQNRGKRLIKRARNGALLWHLSSLKIQAPSKHFCSVCINVVPRLQLLNTHSAC